jgi:hypothetical protein
MVMVLSEANESGQDGSVSALKYQGNVKWPAGQAEGHLPASTCLTVRLLNLVMLLARAKDRGSDTRGGGGRPADDCHAIAQNLWAAATTPEPPESQRPEPLPDRRT